MAIELADVQQITGVIESLSLARREGQFDRLEPLFAENAVFQNSEGHRLVEGKAACIQSYRDFMGVAKVLAYDEEKPGLIPFAGFVMANYRWRIDYEMNGTNFLRSRPRLAGPGETE